MKKVSTILRDEKQRGQKKGLYHSMQINFAYNTNRIEGSRLSQEQTQHIFQTKSFTTVENEYIKIDDILETINHFKLFDLVIDNAEIELSEELIKQFQSVLKQGTSSTRVIGDYKQMKNYVGNIKTATPTQVKPMMKKLLGEYNSTESVTIEDIIDFHYQFETIHPFEDGNGRVGRIIDRKRVV